MFLVDEEILNSLYQANIIDFHDENLLVRIFIYEMKQWFIMRVYCFFL